jgi:hypothetical protein
MSQRGRAAIGILLCLASTERDRHDMRLLLQCLLLGLVACSDDASDGAPEILLGRSALEFSAVASGPVPPVQAVRVDNVGGGNLIGLSAEVSYTGDQATDWLRATLSSDGAPSLLSAEITTTELPAGAHRATIRVASTLTGVAPATLAATYVVEPTPALEFAPGAVAFTGPPGSGALSQLVEVRNAGGGTAEDLQAATEYAVGEPSAWLTIFLDAPRTPATIFLTARTGALAPGTYTATVQVTSSNAANSPASFIVTLTVT